MLLHDVHVLWDREVDLVQYPGIVPAIPTADNLGYGSDSGAPPALFPRICKVLCQEMLPPEMTL